MRALIVHRLTYRYDAPVFLGEHRLCLRPRGQGFQTLLEHQLNVLPEPHQRRELVAASGDEIQRLRFLGSTEELIFEARSLVETRPAPPLESCFNGLEPPLPYPRGQLNSDLQGALEGWLLPIRASWVRSMAEGSCWPLGNQPSRAPCRSLLSWPRG